MPQSESSANHYSPLQTRLTQCRALPPLAWCQNRGFARSLHTLSLNANVHRSSPTVFSLGDHRRRVLGPTEKLPPDYFSPSGRTPETEEMRRRVRDSLEDDVSKFFSEGRGQVAIYDANVSPLGVRVEEREELTFSSSQNGTRAVRKEVREKFESMGINVFFIGE